ncbi:Uma2 family endonuclease [Phytohabitans rumicis]|uniref:Putative restriction endonuclease domain-containing protein n=1 Tax=Phytohabitans rumicis TaxID=1076125 RepID=A0A6V8L519_9ACTN|nr:Uma2 family endonuclease [Phytohabitans rumicis]GFJ92362.1 hypothetical protein Prum_060040 [Phytohabitans rumicis]
MTTVHPGPAARVELPNRELTLDDVAELAARDSGHRYELDNGNLLVMAPADVDHQQVMMRLAIWFITNGCDSDLVLATPGLRISERTSGRCPDLLITRRRPDGRTVWVDPADVALVVEIVSRGSEKLDRMIKPDEYARAGIVYYWRVERGGNDTTVHQYQLGRDERGEPAYVSHQAVLLTELLAGQPPTLA